MSEPVEEKLTGKIDILSGGAFPSSGFNELEGLPLIRIRDLESGSTEVRFRGRYDARYIVKNGDILIGMDGDFLVRRWSGSAALLNQRVCKVSPCDDQIDEKFLYWYLQPTIFEIHRKTPQTTVRHLSSKNVFEISAPKIGLDEQRIAGKILDTLDTAIQRTEAIIEKLKQVKQGLLHDLLTRGINANGELRPPADEAPELYQDTPLGKIPKAWGYSLLSKLSDDDGLMNGVFKEPSRVGSGVPLVNVADLYRGESVDLNGCELFDATMKERAKYGVQVGDIFFTRSSLKLEGIAQTSFMESEAGDAVFECHVMRLRPDQRKVVPRFLKEWCIAPNARSHFMSHAKQVTMTTISQDGISGLECPMPPLPEQEIAVKRINAMEAELSKEKTEVEKLRSMKQGLMDDLLTGRVRVTDLLAASSG